MDMKNADNKKTVYDILAERFVAALEKGTVPWRALHSASRRSMWPKNAATGRPYNGANVALLSVTQQAGSYAHNLWVTFNQARSLGGVVRKGEKGTPVFFYSVFEKKDQIDPNTGLPAKRFVLRYSTVFNIAQCDGLKLPKGRIQEEEVAKPVLPGADLALAAQVADAYIQRSGVTLTHFDDTPHYNISRDAVVLPAMSKFETPAAYYSTLFHEIAHSTGAKKRRNRPLNTHRQSQDYSFEELVAESSAAFLLAHCGVNDDTLTANNAAYIAGWTSALKNDPKMIMRACSEALKVAEYVVGGKLYGTEAPEATTTDATPDAGDGTAEVPSVSVGDPLDVLFA